MIELRLNAATGKYEKPGEPAYGRVYKVVDQITGKVGYNCTTSDLPGLDQDRAAMIEKYDTFAGWVTGIISLDETRATVKSLNAAPAQFVETPHVLLVARVKRRLTEGNSGVMDGYDVLDDLREMYADIMGRRVRPALPGWNEQGLPW